MSQVCLLSPSRAAALRYEIDPERHVRVEEYHGLVGLEDIKALTRAVASDPEWEPDMNGLVDFSDARLELSADDVMRLALMWREKEFRTSGWLAFAVPSAAMFGVVRMLSFWARMAERTRLFPNREEAEQWLLQQGRRLPRRPFPKAADTRCA
jgi:hypothetical protein